MDTNALHQVCNYLNEDMKDHLEIGHNWHIDPGKLEAAIESTNLTDSKTAQFLLEETGDGIKKEIAVTVTQGNPGLCFQFEGYGDCCSVSGTPLIIEQYDNDLIVRIYSDITKDEPTHSISLSGAKVEPKRNNDMKLLDISMSMIVGDYNDPDEVKEWHWVKKNASFSHTDNGESGTYEFIINLANDLFDIPEQLKPIIGKAIEDDCSYLAFHQ